MLSLPIAFTSVIGVFAPVFSRPVWQHVKSPYIPPELRGKEMPPLIESLRR